jgi:hypothetical protein
LKRALNLAGSVCLVAALAALLIDCSARSLNASSTLIDFWDHIFPGDATKHFTAELLAVAADTVVLSEIDDWVKSIDRKAQAEVNEDNRFAIVNHTPTTKTAASGTLGAVIDGISGFHPLSFRSGMPGFDSLNPGSRNLSSSPVIFSEVYKSRVASGDVSSWLDYARGALRANNYVARDVLSSQKTLKDLNDLGKLDLQATGYIQLEQVGGQMTNFLSHELSKLRVDVARQVEFEVEFSLNEQQEKTDELDAFAQAAKSWAAPSLTGALY